MDEYVDTDLYVPAGIAHTLLQDSLPDAVTEAQYAREQFLATAQGLANPQFKLTKRHNPLIDLPGGIRRGYIRRSDIDASDPTSSYRLYFMYNPSVIQRSYMAYLDQQALDPGNALFGSNNMAAAPGIVDFTFELLFDRHLEVASNPGHPGTKVDYDYFDLVVRGVVPDSGDTGNAIPDNGIMMVNPKNVVVVFGQDLSVQGRPYNASVSFEKFNNRMTPTRLRISIAMKAFYIGPVQTIPNYSLYSTESNVKATVPYDESVTYTATYEQVKFKKLKVGVDTVPSKFSSSNIQPRTPYSGPIGQNPAGIPRGPFPIRIVRRGYQSVTSDVDPVQLSGDQILSLLLAKECPLEGAAFLWALAKRESGFVANICGINTNGSYDVGLWQINDVNWGGIAAEQVADPWTNVDITMRLSAGGTRFVPWQTSGNYSSPDGSHLNGINMDEAYSFFASRGYPVSA